MSEISVNLPTHNRADFLEACLTGLCEQTIDPARYEICVVDNASTDATPDIVARVAARYPNHRLFRVEEPRLGLSRARNTGVRATTAPLIANTDDDGTVYPTWLEQFLARFAEFGDDLAIVGGDIEPIWGATPPDWLGDEMKSHLSARAGQGAEAHFVDENGYCLEGNSCYRRSFLEQAGGFPEHLGRIGPHLLSGEGVLEFGIRKLGGKLFFDPAIILKHYIHADRLNASWLRHRYFWQGISYFYGRQYKEKVGYPVTNAVSVSLPLTPQDWAFVNRPPAQDVPGDLHKFRDLGFVLAMTGIITPDN